MVLFEGEPFLFWCEERNNFLEITHLFGRYFALQNPSNIQRPFWRILLFVEILAYFKNFSPPFITMGEVSPPLSIDRQFTYILE